MPDWTLVNRAHVLAALDEFDRLGSREFMSRYSFGRSAAYTLWHGGQEYDPTAILGVAYLHATGRAATRDEFRGGLSGAVRVLEGLGFDIVVDDEELEHEERRLQARPVSTPAATGTGSSTPAAKKPARAPAKTARAKPVEVPVKICPNCYTALPATGVCDYCD
ncbi:MAG: hypothetical protein ACXWDI_14010 [Nocardioides sp.]